jgi:NAD(P) transhydrogenase
VFHIDLEDDAVQNMLIAYDGDARFPDKITPYNPPPPKASSIAEKELSPQEKAALADQEQKSNFIRNTVLASLAAAALVAFGFTTDSSDSVALVSTFALAGLAGYQVVWGVAPSLVSCIMT